MYRRWIAGAGLVAAMLYAAVGLSGRAQGQSDPVVEHPSLTLTDVARVRGILGYRNDRGLGSGVSVADFDNDGDLDIFVPQAKGRSNQLYVNSGEGFFDEMASAWGLSSSDSSRVALWLDIDNDQDLDLLVANDNETATSSFRLYRRDPTWFTDISVAAGVIKKPVTETNPFRWSGMAAGDLNNDGYIDWISGQWLGPTHVFFNDGDGTFTDVTNTCGMSPYSRFNHQPIMYDFNGDGWLDVYMLNDFEPNELWINQQDGTFIDKAAAAGLNNAMNDMGVTMGDYDNDGDLDIYITNIYSPENLDDEYNVLYRNDSVRDTLRFTDVTKAAGVGMGGWGWGTTFMDIDRDGNLDIAATNGWSTSEWVTDTSRFFWNPSGGQTGFIEEGARIGFNDTFWGSALVAADFDRDGDLDLLQSCLESALTSARLRLLDNEPGSPSDMNHWLVVRPRIDGPNHYALGAVVRCQAAGKNMMRLITAGTSYMGQEPAEAFFGLGLGVLANVRIEWPDGFVTDTTGVAVDQVLNITRPGVLTPNVTVVTSSGALQKASVEWRVEGMSSLPVAVQRSAAGGAWMEVAQAMTDVNGRVGYEDTAITPGGVYRYRIAFDIGPNSFELGETTVRIPGLNLAVTSVRPNPSPGEIIVSFELPSSAPATLELLDLSGRKLRTVNVGAFGAGAHVLNLSEGLNLRPALYVVRLTNGDQESTRKVAIVP